MGDPLAWDRDGRDWPNRAASRFVEAGGIHWHVQQLGQGPVLLLLHGTGAATHSWRDLAPRLAQHFTVVAPDLPGHGFTRSPDDSSLSLPGMAAAVRALLDVLAIRPDLVAGHSAGAAVLIRMALDGMIAPRGIVSINGALIPFRGVAGHTFAPIARVLAANTLTARLFAWWAEGHGPIRGILNSTGSTITADGEALYARLARNPGHVHAALTMMASWDLAPLTAELPRLDVPLLLIAGGRDGTVPPDESFQARDLVPGARVVCLRTLGHLAHEEKPAEIAGLIDEFWGEVGPDDR
ncbi:alpha/beta fold hydrolase [Rhodoplanes sp. TEM]|uniref:Alpha/beta fold hydrolase n=1 Tax=Rhodoplanes tepidamans TaxID=200616 RepID=A0ABT5J6F8_RHOTP|nr:MULTISPECIES: alpha/beta fold hydrolase BchO [Rhodoplanes]MDC7784625.1 alpha/beta fold hydrolase [Rhodoplanes tepidamans]MDC7982917.1 alpha/beta fold hydrolase [Rhodoplanes sp. TEM]MDQ0355853.1 magnesium chelatase accessory protein [Rhodoplanes tepidamans]